MGTFCSGWFLTFCIKIITNKNKLRLSSVRYMGCVVFVCVDSLIEGTTGSRGKSAVPVPASKLPGRHLEEILPYPMYIPHIYGFLALTFNKISLFRLVYCDQRPLELKCASRARSQVTPSGILTYLGQTYRSYLCEPFESALKRCAV